MPGGRQPSRAAWYATIWSRRPMNPQHWLDVERLFHEALALPAQGRTAFLDDSCAGNEALKRDVQSLLDESSADDFLERPALEPGATRLQHTPTSLVGRR